MIQKKKRLVALKNNRLFVPACHAGHLGDNPRPVGSVPSKERDTATVSVVDVQLFFMSPVLAASGPSGGPTHDGSRSGVPPDVVRLPNAPCPVPLPVVLGSTLAHVPAALRPLSWPIGGSIHVRLPPDAQRRGETILAAK